MANAAVVVAAASLLAACATQLGTAATASFAPLVDRSAGAVVGIAEAPEPRDAVQGAPAIQVIGSGFRVGDRTIVATAAHVVRALRGQPVVVWNSRPFRARISHFDGQADIVLLEIDADAPIPGLVLAADASERAGDWVLVLGCPFGTLPTVTVGVVSALPGAVLRPEAYRRQIQLNAAINPGNSGGPVVNMNAEVVGIADAAVSAGHGLGFAVPVAALRRLIALRDADR